MKRNSISRGRMVAIVNVHKGVLILSKLVRVSPSHYQGW
jgi:hypothetical protein